MATTYHHALQQLYVAYFNRPADPGGLAFYANHLEQGNTTIEAIAADFSRSPEYRDEYDQATDAGIVSRVYTNLFGHAPDPEGLAFYVQALRAQTMTVATMVTWIARGAQGADKAAFDSKVDVATAFTMALDTEAEIAGYNRVGAQAAAKALLSTITTADDAIAALLPASLDKHVAAVLKAGIPRPIPLPIPRPDPSPDPIPDPTPDPFSLGKALATLAAANDAVEDFLEGFAEEHGMEEAGARDVADAVDAAEAALSVLIGNSEFAEASNDVQVAIIAEQEASSTGTLDRALATLASAQEAVARVDGLGSAIAAAARAREGVRSAEEVLGGAEEALAGAGASLGGQNPDLNFSTDPETGAEALVDAEGDLIAFVNGDGRMEIAREVDVGGYPGLAAFVVAYNAAAAAEAAFLSAADALMSAQLRAERLDLDSTALLADAFTFTATRPAQAAAPTYEDILGELDALGAASARADTALAAADEDDSDYETLLIQALEAADALIGFRVQIAGFIAANGTPLADAVALAEEGALRQARAAVAAVAGLEEAAAAAETAAAALRDAIDAEAAVQAAFDERAIAFEVANRGAAVNLDGTVVFDDAGTQVDLVVLDAGVLRAAPGVDDSTYPGVDALVAAGNAMIGAEAALAVADTLHTNAVAARNVLDGGELAALAAAELAAASPVEAVRVAALGVQGAQAAVDALAERVAELESAQAAAARLKSLSDAVAAALAEFEANDYNAPSMLDARTASGRSGSDIFVLAGAEIASIADFGHSGDDVLYIGEGYTMNEGDFGEDGNDAVLEVFFVRSGADTIVTIETSTSASNAGQTAVRITLAGVNADDLSFENGIISL